jgi:hypothetical protein
MKLPITIEYNSGEQATYVAQPPEWAKWERDRGVTYHAHKREAAGKPVKSYEVWSETVADVIVGDANPKAIQQEA